MDEVCIYKDKCTEFNKLSIDEQQCCDELFTSCPIWKAYKLDEMYNLKEINYG